MQCLCTSVLFSHGALLFVALPADEATRPKEGGEAESDKGERPTEASKAQMHGSRKDAGKTSKDPETAAEGERLAPAVASCCQQLGSIRGLPSLQPYALYRE